MICVITKKIYTFLQTKEILLKTGASIPEIGRLLLPRPRSYNIFKH